MLGSIRETDWSGLTTQTASGVTAMLLPAETRGTLTWPPGAGGRAMVSTTTPDAGSIRDTLAGMSLSPSVGPLPTQTAPAPAATSVGRDEVPKTRRTRLVSGSICVTVLSSPSSTQMLPSPTATLEGEVPKEISLRMAPVSGSSTIAPALSSPPPRSRQTPGSGPERHGEEQCTRHSDAPGVTPGGSRDKSRPRSPPRRAELRVLLEDLPLEAPQRLARLEPELRGEVLPALLVHLQRLCLTTRAVQGQHELTAEALAERVALHERLELADQLVVEAQGEIGVDPLLERGQPKLLEPCDLRLGERLVRDVGQRRAVPQREPLSKPLGRPLRIVARKSLPPLLQQALEDVRIERVGCDAEDVAVPLRLEPGSGRGVAVGIGERPPEPRDVRLQRLRGGRRRALAPEVVDELVLRHDLVRAEEEGGEQRTLLGAAEVEAPAVFHDLQWAEDPKLHPALTPFFPAPNPSSAPPGARCKRLSRVCSRFATPAPHARPIGRRRRSPTEEERCCTRHSRGSQPAPRWRRPRSSPRPEPRPRMRSSADDRASYGPGAIAQTNDWVIAEGVVRPDDRATHGPGALVAAQRDIVLRPDDRADRRLPSDAPGTQPTTGEAFDWVDAGIGSAATLGLVLLLAGASVLRLRHGTQTA